MGLNRRYDRRRTRTYAVFIVQIVEKQPIIGVDLRYKTRAKPIR